MPDLEYKFLELKADALQGRVLTGPALVYGDIADQGRFKETFAVGAFGNTHLSELVRLNLQHDRGRLLSRVGSGMVLTDSLEQLYLSADIAATRDGDDAIELFNKRILRGLSVEIQPIADKFVGRLRTITKAMLTGIGLVDVPAFPKSVPDNIRWAVEVESRGRRLWL